MKRPWLAVLIALAWWVFIFTVFPVNAMTKYADGSLMLTAEEVGNIEFNIGKKEAELAVAIAEVAYLREKLDKGKCE